MTDLWLTMPTAPRNWTPVWVTVKIKMLYDSTPKGYRQVCVAYYDTDTNAWHKLYSTGKVELKPLVWMPYHEPEPWDG
jgi:hypothetical protein